MPDKAAAPVPSPDAEDTAQSDDRGNVEFLGSDRYRIGMKLGEGSFGVVFKGVKLKGEGQYVAIKFLRDEYRTYLMLTDRGETQVDGIPRIHFFGPLHLYNVLVVDLLGSSLESIFAEHERRFSLKTVAMLAKLMLGVVERVHAKCILHRDLKPDNFLLGRPGTPAANKVHLIDFGMAKRYRDPKTQEHIPDREGKSPVGTARYMSINAHLGREQSRRDDLEALCYVWLYFLRGSLPWQGIKASTNKMHKRIREKKQKTAIEDLCTGFPVGFAECLRYVRHLGFDDEPDYGYLQSLLSRVLKDIGEVDDGRFDWVKVEEERPRLEIRPPRRSDSAAGPGKRRRAVSVPDQGDIRAKEPPARLYNIAEEEMSVGKTGAVATVARSYRVGPGGGVGPRPPHRQGRRAGDPGARLKVIPCEMTEIDKVLAFVNRMSRRNDNRGWYCQYAMLADTQNTYDIIPGLQGKTIIAAALAY
ncbi:hypothetical protein VTK26DRAFT_3135 [Humicola hyalothermophila]